MKFVCAAVVLMLALALPDAGRASSPAVLRLHWRVVASNTSQFATNGRYVFFDNNYVNIDPGESGTLIDDQTGKRTSLPGCTDPMFGGPWLSLDCASAGAGGFSLYQLATRHWRTVQLFCAGHADPLYECRPTALGAKWIAVTYGEGCYEHYCPVSEGAQNIWTGQSANLPSTPPGGRRVIDLNYPTLVRTVCRPLRVPTSTDTYDTGSQQAPGSLTFYGPFAVASGNLPNAVPYAYVARCRSRLHVPLPPGRIPIDGNRHLIVWQVLHRRLGGRMLPSLRRFRIPLPANIIHAYGVLVGVTQRHIYLQTTGVEKPGDRLWAATLPPLH